MVIENTHLDYNASERSLRMEHLIGNGPARIEEDEDEDRDDLEEPNDS